MYLLNNCDCTFVNPNGSDHVICDPPYSEHTHSSAVSQVDGVFSKNEFGFSSIDVDLQRYIAKACSVATGYSAVFSDDKSLGSWGTVLRNVGCDVVRVVPWCRWSSPSIVKGRPPSMVEFILIVRSEHGKETFSGPGNFGLFEAKCLRGAGKHKTGKPLDLMLQLIDHFTVEGSRVYDPTMGRGTTGLACAITGRHFMGCEVNPVEFEAAKERLDAWAEREELDATDASRLIRFRELQADIEADKARISGNTERVRARNKSRKGLLDPADAKDALDDPECMTLEVS